MTPGGVGVSAPLPLILAPRWCAFETGSELRAGLSKWIGYYNTRRPHSTLAGRTPDEAYRTDEMGRVELAA